MAKKQFKAESKRLLDLMIHSIYTNKEIFLRELISNASDAIDKLCYLSLADESVGMKREDFAIDIVADKGKRTLTISDNGIGMTKEELEQNLGTIAKSGSLEFKDAMKKADGEAGEDAGAIDIIGQFGVGFYSAFMVSDEVTVISRAHGSGEAWKWNSTGSEGYTLTACEKDKPGTDIIMKIKEDTEDEQYGEYLEEYRLSALVKKYSDYIRFPIRMDREKRVPKPQTDAEKEEGKAPEYETAVENETLNSMVPIWQRNKNEVTQEDYENFYKEKFYDYEKPLRCVHVDAEGVVSYKALLFIPARASYDYYTKDYQKGLKLYSSGVLIMDSCADLLPEHFRFVRGVVDSPDLSLNISREMLQQTRPLKTIAQNLEKKIKSELLKMLTGEREKYEDFYKHFGLQLKYGVVGEWGRNKELLEDLLLFSTSYGDKPATLAEYVTRMQAEQPAIYYATGESAQKIAALPQAELLKEKNYEILCFTHEVDEFVAQTLRAYQEKEFKSVNSDDLGLETEEQKKDAEKRAEESKGVLEFIKSELGDTVKEVKLSAKLKSYPACLTAEGGMSFEMEKYLQQVQPDAAVKAQRVLELNAGHEVFQKLRGMYEAEPEKAKQYVQVLYHQALLMAGLPIEDPAAYSSLVFSLLG